VVTGIAATRDTSAVERALRDAGLSLDPLSIYVADELPEGRPDSGARFIYTGSDSIREILGRSEGIYATGAGSVPGLESSAPTAYFPQETMEDELSELNIPDSEVDNYDEAIERGHAVVAYFAHPDTAPTIEGIFRATGLANVRTF
jgi:hypothetical protein